MKIERLFLKDRRLKCNKFRPKEGDNKENIANNKRRVQKSTRGAKTTIKSCKVAQE